MDLEIHFIMVEPAIPENIGAAARAIKTMGFMALRLVAPAAHLDVRARTLAHGSADILENAEIFETLEEALNDLDYIIGTSAKRKSAHHDYHAAADLPAIIREKGAAIRRVGLLFGKEESGLSNAQLGLCDIVSYISLHQPYPSLNLSQAIMVYAYILSSLHHLPPKKLDETSTNLSYRALKEKTTTILKNMGVSENITLHNRIMERLALLNADDINLVHSIANAYTDKLKKGFPDKD
jgi:tRNA/rRNA methyltransferase